MAKSVSMDNIAAELNISKSLVSRALSDKYGVSDEMRNKIRTTAVKMGYMFKGKKKDSFIKTESITIVIERHDLLDSGFWLKIINGIEKELNTKNISVFLSVIEDEEEELMPLSIKQLKTNGVLICGRIPLKNIVAVSTTGLPIVTIDTIYPDLKFDSVMANNYFGAYEATEYIINSGHRKIGFVGSKSYSYSFKERLRGFTACIANHQDLDIAFLEITNDFDDTNTPFSRKQFNEMILSESRPTALVCANDPIAFFAYDILKDAGLKIPEDISIIGFDNVEKCEWVTPKLTSVNVHKNEIGKIASEFIIGRIENNGSTNKMVLVGTEIVKRESVNNPEKNSKMLRK